MLLTPNADRKFPVIEAFVIIIILLENWTFQNISSVQIPANLKKGEQRRGWILNIWNKGGGKKLFDILQKLTLS